MELLQLDAARARHRNGRVIEDLPSRQRDRGGLPRKFACGRKGVAVQTGAASRGDRIGVRAASDQMLGVMQLGRRTKPFLWPARPLLPR